MSFDSIFYLCCFLPLALGLYWLTPGLRLKNWLLLIMGLVFYSFGSFSGILLLLMSAAVSFVLGLLIRRQKLAKTAMIVGVAGNILFLLTYKYLGSLLSQMFGLTQAAQSLIAPIGISFFTFKNISYLIDGFREPAKITHRFQDYLLYISFFPQIMAGPITRYDDFSAQLQSRNCDLDKFTDGLQRFILGLFKKVILCAIVGSVVDKIFSMESDLLDFRLAWIGAIGYMVQIYFDFAGYSDMAIGMGVMLGFHTPENFNYPYIASSVADFWRRWHISLSTWFKDYLYIPLGGNRKGQLRAALNKLIVFLLCGLWHGYGLTFLLWGAWHGLFSALESLKIINPKKLPKFLAHIYTLLVVCLGFVMFRASSAQDGFRVLGAMFTGFFCSSGTTIALHQILNLKTIAFLLGGCVFCTPLAKKIPCPCILRCVGCIGLYFLCLAALASGGFTPFIYFQF